MILVVSMKVVVEMHESSSSFGKNILAPLEITAVASAIDAAIQKKTHDSGRLSDSASQTTTCIISNEEMNDILKIVQALEDPNSLQKGVTKTIKNETKEQNGEFLGMLLESSGAILLGNMLVGKGIVRAGYGHGKGIVRAGYGNKIDF